jgi:mannan endo-1,4-beta-mannosidase
VLGAVFAAGLTVGVAGSAAGRTHVVMVGPHDGAVVSGRITWGAHVRGGKASRVRFAVDGVLRSTDDTAPYLFDGGRHRFDTRTIANGLHRLTATASVGGSSFTQMVHVRVRNRVASSSIYWGAYIEGDQTYGHLFGGKWDDAPWGGATWDRFEADAGKRISVVHYGQPPPWERGFDQGPFALALKRGAIPAVDMSTKSVPLREIAGGRYDDSIAAWARSAKAWGRPFFFILDVEMNGPWEAYGPTVNGNTPQDFVLAWRHMHDIFTAAGATNVTWVWCPNVDPRKKFVPYRDLYPGDRYVDWTGLDGYDFDGTASFSWLFSSSYAKLLELAPTKPVMLSQVAAEELTGRKPAWITDALGTQLPRHFPRVKAVLWFNWRIFEQGRWLDWEIESSPAAQSAFRQAIASPYYRPGGEGAQMPLLTKVGPVP